MPRWRILGLEEDNLRRLYIDKGLPAYKIGELLGCEEATVRRHLRTHNIPLRTHSEVIQGRSYPDRQTSGLTKTELKKLYLEEKLSTKEVGRRLGCSQPTVSKALKRFGIVARPKSTIRVWGLEENKLRDLYINRRLPTIEIAKIFGCNPETVTNRLKRLNIPLRTKSEALTGRVFSEDHKRKIRERTKEVLVPGSTHPAWKGGRQINNYGYVLLRIDGKYVLEHRHVMQQHLGYTLNPWDEVNHINGVKTDNSLENLEVIPNEHKRKDWLRTHPDWNKSESKPQS